MPKMKVNSGTSKRFRATGTGKLKRKQAGKGHKLTKKATKRKRALTGFVDVNHADLANMKLLLAMK